MNQVNKSATATPTIVTQACKIASGMLYQDRFWLIKAYLILSLPAYATLLTNNLQTGLVLQIIERALQLTILFLLGQRWFSRFSNKQNSLNYLESAPQKFWTLCIYGFALWLLFQGPSILLLASTGATAKTLGLIIWGPAALIGLAYYFYFFPIISGKLQPAVIHSDSLAFFRSDRLLAIKTMLAPIALMLLISNIISAFSPDDSLVTVVYVRAFFMGIFFIFSSYLALAVGFVSLGDKAWHDLGLDPYRSGRFSTLSVQGPKLLAQLLLPKNGIKMLVVALLVGLANLAAVIGKPPSGEVLVKSIKLHDNVLTLELQIHDPKNKSRNLNASFFTVAGPNLELITKSRIANKIVVDGQIIQAINSATLNADETLEIELSFESDRSANELKQLEDLYLWYNQAKLQKVDMQRAVILNLPANIYQEPASASP